MRTLITVLALTMSMVSASTAVARCRAYTNRLSYTGNLAIGEARLVTEWKSPCEGAINASAAKGRLTLLVFENGVWQKVKEGISTIVPVAPAGTYRLVVTNPYGIPSDYAVSVKYGRG
jgi:hypothetical protein